MCFTTILHQSNEFQQNSTKQKNSILNTIYKKVFIINQRSKSAIGSFTENITNGLKNSPMSAFFLDFESFTKMKPKNHQKMLLFDIFENVDLEKFS